MRKPRQGTCRQLEQFLSALFLPDEFIEIRFIESWVSRGKKRSRVVRAAQWLRPQEFAAQHGAITDLAERERANIYFGVCPRPRKGDSHDDCIKTVRCLWSDIDSVTVEEACKRWKDVEVPQPSIVVRSGSGVHGYWLLERDLESPEERLQIAAMLPHFYGSFGGDRVQNLSRVMRAPGTLDYKDARNGRPARPCAICTYRPEVRYPLEAFSLWIEQAEAERQQMTLSGSTGSPTELSADATVVSNPAALAIACRLAKPSRDRSRRDFAIVCDLLRLGLTKEEIWPLVCHRSKFESNGRPYFDLTIANAERRILRDHPTAGRTISST